DADAKVADLGLADVTFNRFDAGRFKSPSLRNVEHTGPYMHDGRFQTLAEVVDHYGSGIKSHPNLDGRLRGPGRDRLRTSPGERLIDDLKLSGQQREQARAALRAYDDKVRQATAEARRELVERMKDVLTADDLAAFKADLDQVPLLPAVVLGPRGVPADDLIG